MPNTINEVRCTSKESKTSVGLGFILSNFNLGCTPRGDGDGELVNYAIHQSAKYRLAVVSVLDHGSDYTIGFEGLHLNEVIMYFLYRTIGNLTVDNKREDGAMNSTDRLNYIRSILGQAAVIANYVSHRRIDDNAIMDATVSYLDSVNPHLVPGLVRLIEIMRNSKGTDRIPALCGWYMSAQSGADLDMVSAVRIAVDRIPFKVNRALIGLFKSMTGSDFQQYMENDSEPIGESTNEK